MSPQFIIILTVSLSSLLIVALFVIRKKNKAHKSDLPTAQTTAEESPKMSENTGPLVTEESPPEQVLENLSSINLDDLQLEDISFSQTTTLPLRQSDSPSGIPLETLDLDIDDEALLPYQNTTSKDPLKSELTAPPAAEIASEPETTAKDPFIDLIELVNRYKFFQGKNLEKFEKFLRNNNISGIETLIREKFLAQKHSDAADKAHTVTKKLLASLPIF